MRRPKYRRLASRDRGFVEYQGKRTYLPGAWKSSESMAAYRQFLLENGLLYLEPPEGRPQTIARLAELFIEWANATYPPGYRSEAANCRAAIGHLIRLDAGTKIRDYGPTRLKDLQVYLAGKRKSRTYINAVCSRIKRAFKWAVSEELIDASVYHAIDTVPGLRKGRSMAKERPKRQPVLWEQIEPVLPQLSGTVRAMVLLHWHTGARSQSICGARSSQFDRSQQPWEWRPRHKTEHLDHELLLFIGPKAQAVIGELFDGRDYLFQPRHMNGKRAKGYRSFYDAQSYMRAVSRAIDRVNRQRAKDGRPAIQRWTPHQLRHARGTLVRETHGLEAAQASLGHRKIDATQIYAQAQMAKARAVAMETG